MSEEKGKRMRERERERRERKKPIKKWKRGGSRRDHATLHGKRNKLLGSQHTAPRLSLISLLGKETPTFLACLVERAASGYQSIHLSLFSGTVCSARQRRKA